MIRVLVVDDSAVVRKVLAEELSALGGIEVVGTAVDPYAARDRIAELSPDVITLDIEMPRMDGLSFLAKLMKHHPIPVVVVSSVTPENSQTALQALELGAVEVIPKPGSQFSVPEVRRTLARAIRAAAVADLSRSTIKSRAKVARVESVGLSRVNTTHKLIAMGASTGGTKALEVVLSSMPADAPGIVVVQHMPGGFTGSFAERLNDTCRVEVREGQDGDPIVPGRCLIAPGGYHIMIVRSGSRTKVKVRKGPPVNHHRPSVDVLFSSVAREVGRNAVGVIMTGMGSDGARGLQQIREAGGHTVAQDEETSVVFGMPRAAISLDAAMEVVPLEQIAEAALAPVRGTLRSSDVR
ncbi:MAG: chemotaxis response regulator protein-glutamate methylesterase [Gemmatimonadota bacterium]